MRASLLLALAVLSSGCVRRYALEPALSFQDLPYLDAAGKPWELKSLPLEGARARHSLGVTPVLRYVELNAGAPRTVVFLHGLGSYLKFWKAQLEATAARGYRVIALDQLGFGKSDKPAGFPYTTEAFAENVDEVLEKLGVARAVVVGHSMGGQTALALALRFPARVEGLVLASPAGFETFSPREQKWFKNVYARTLVKDADEEAIWGNIRLYNFARWRPEYEWLIEERVRVAGSPEFDAYAYAQVRTVEGLARNEFVRESLGKVAAPTIVIFGSADRLIPNPFLHAGPTRWTMERGAQAIPGSVLTELSGCGHTVQLDCSEEFNQAFFGFLDKLGAPRPE